MTYDKELEPDLKAVKWFADTLYLPLPVVEKNPTIISAEEILEGLDGEN